MNEESANGNSDSNAEPSAEGSPFESIVDDREQRELLADWAEQQLLAGRSFEDLKTELVTGGWSDEDAEELVESARRQTRRERGVVTQADVRRTLNQNYVQSMRLSWFSGMPAWAALRRFLFAIATIRSLRRVRRK